MRLRVRLTPRGGGDRIEGWAEDADGREILKARVSAAPADGAANAALVKLIAGALGLPKSRVRIVSGETVRLKTLEIDGADPDRLSALGR